MTDNQELIIKPNGVAFIRDTVESPVLNTEAVVRLITSVPDFSIPMCKDTQFVLSNDRMFCIRAVSEFSIKARWTLSEGNGETGIFETPCFSDGIASVSRQFKVPVPTVMIIEVPSSIKFPLSRSEEHLMVFLFGMTHDCGATGIKKFLNYPLANIHGDGRLCTGELENCHSLYDVSEATFTAWEANRWNSDLWNLDNSMKCNKLVRFDPESGEQLMPCVDTEADVLPMFDVIAPSIPAAVLNKAWDLTHV